MNVTRLDLVPPPIEAMPVGHVVLDSDGESEGEREDAPPRVNRTNGVDHIELVEGDSGEGSVDSEEQDDWSIDSLIEDVIEELSDDQLLGVPDSCTPEEGAKYRALLRSIGPEEFCRQTVECGAVSAKRLLTAFRVRLPDFLEGQPDDSYYGFLSLAISRELSKRIKLPQYNTIEDAVNLLKKSRNIIVLTGAGISTSLGIPDFRSKENGLYARLEHLGLDDPQQVFDIETFRNDPTIFFGVAKDILPSIERYSPTHAFIHLLQQKGKLLTNYSQNIDNIESVAGILPEKLIQCHGSFATATCADPTCGHKVPGETIFPEIKAGRIPRCEACTSRLQATLKPGGAMKRKRSRNGQDKKKRRNDYSSDDDSDYDIPEAGVMKPDITFFGEALPDKFSQRLTGHDKDLVDLVIVIGTSLKVAPVSEIVPYLPAHVPQMYISMKEVTHVNFDIDLLGPCDIIVAELCRRAGWDLSHEMIPKDQKIEVKLEEGYTSRYTFVEKQ